MASSAARLKERVEWICWDAVGCGNRLKFIVQLPRFVIIQAHCSGYLASHCLGRALRELPAQWQCLHGFCPLFGESFHDPARHQGTLFRRR
ncbi:MAG: hypothetical protein ACRCXD_11630 [Luteolibacter sp.]